MVHNVMQLSCAVKPSGKALASSNVLTLPVRSGVAHLDHLQRQRGRRDGVKRGRRSPRKILYLTV